MSKELDNHWSYIIEKDIPIPSHLIFEGNEDEAVRCTPTGYLPKLRCNNPVIPAKISPNPSDSNGIEDNEEDEEILIDFTKAVVDESIESTGNYKTKCCYLLSLVIGDIPLLSKYDHGLFSYNARKTPSAFHEGILQKIKDELKFHLDLKVSESKRIVNKWEALFISENELSAPTQDDYNKNSNILDRIEKIRISDSIYQQFFSS